MSLLTDREYLLHTFQLSFVRDVLPSHATLPNPLSLVSFPPSSILSTNPYLAHSSLADEEQWPELRSGRDSPPMAAGPREARRGLAYSATIGKIGGAGMRVDSRRAGGWRSRRAEGTDGSGLDPSSANEGDSSVTEGERGEFAGRPTTLEESIHRRRLSQGPPPPVVIHSPVRTPVSSPLPSASTSTLQQQQQQATQPAPPDSVPTSALSESPSESFSQSQSPFVAHSPIAAEEPRSALLSTSSNRSEESEDGEVSDDEEEEEEEEASVASSGVSLFGVSRRTPSLGNGSSSLIPSVRDTSSLPTNDGTEILTPPPPPPLASPAAGAPGAPPTRFRPLRERRRVNISGRMLVPIAEPPNEDSGVPHPIPAIGETTPAGRQRSHTDPPLLSPLAPTMSPEAPQTHVALSQSLRRKSSAPSVLPGPSPSSSPSTSKSIAAPLPSSVPHSHHHPARLTFGRTPIPVKASQKSTLTSMLTSLDSSSSSTNPFAQLYASLLSRTPSQSLSLTLFFPNSAKPSVPLKLNVRKDICVEEVVGVGLYQLWEEGRMNEEEGDEGTEGWNLRIVEDEVTGEVDDDFPALDRTRGISKFGFGMFAVVKATPQQVKDNLEKQATIQRRPSRILAPPKQLQAAAPALPTAGAFLQPQPILPPPLNPMASFRPGTTVGVSSDLAIPVLLKVILPPSPGVEAINTTINVPNDMYMSDVLDLLCKKRNLDNPKEWALVVRHNEKDLLVPLDRTVESLGENHTISLVRKTSQLAAKAATSGLVNINPSASIFKRLSEPPQPKYQSSTDLTTGTYLHYQVMRKLPMPLGRHPRTIAIDGDYVHFLPTENGGKTSSFHISHVIECKVSRRSQSSFKIVVTGGKRYDFEAESSKVASEIVGVVRAGMERWRKGGV